MNCFQVHLFPVAFNTKTLKLVVHVFTQVTRPFAHYMHLYIFYRAHVLEYLNDCLMLGIPSNVSAPS